MSVIDSLTKALRPLNIYNLNQDTNIYQELLTYANELEKLNLAIDTLLRESFIFTAQSYGLTNFEKIYSAEDKTNTAEERRQKILDRLSINDNSFTLNEMKKSLSSLGVKEYRIIEYPQRCRIVFEIDGEYTDAEVNFINSEINKLAPVSFEIRVSFWGLSWSEIENNNLDFNNMDLQDFSWDAIDKLK